LSIIIGFCTRPLVDFANKPMIIHQILVSVESYPSRSYVPLSWSRLVASIGRLALGAASGFGLPWFVGRLCLNPRKLVLYRPSRMLVAQKSFSPSTINPRWVLFSASGIGLNEPPGIVRRLFLLGVRATRVAGTRANVACSLPHHSIVFSSSGELIERRAWAVHREASAPSCTRAV
jgi:hypothetical protein